jgi:NADPH-dependent 2,4-dienoyl-CoA reductase/sulfur reductase-like enzyme
MVLVIGGGLAGWRTATELRRLGHTGELVILAGEDEMPYDRPPLSKRVLSGADRAEVARLATPDKVAELDIHVELGAWVDRVNDHSVTTRDGRDWEWDRLVVATGATPRRPDFVPAHPRVHMLRTLTDSRRLAEAWRTARSIVVVGGGFIGAEVAAAATAQGLVVTLVEAQSWVAERALGAPVAELLTSLHRDNGVDLRLGVAVQSLHADDGGVRVHLEAGASIVADLAVIGLGVVPHVELLAGGDADITDGILCDHRGRVIGRDSTWAVGDVARWHEVGGRAVRREHWSSAVDQASAAAHDLLGLDIPAELAVPPYVWSDQYGLKVQVLGHPDLADRDGWLDHETGSAVGAYGYWRGEALVGVVTIGPPRLMASHRRTVVQALAEGALGRTCNDMSHER